VARIDLRLSLEELGKLRLRDFRAYHDRYLQALKHRELLAGIIASATVNSGFCRPKESMAPSDFMPSMRGQVEAVSELQQQVDVSFGAALLRARAKAAGRLEKCDADGA
jgi:hypothetical protein